MGKDVLGSGPADGREEGGKRFLQDSFHLDLDPSGIDIVAMYRRYTLRDAGADLRNSLYKLRILK